MGRAYRLNFCFSIKFFEKNKKKTNLFLKFDLKFVATAYVRTPIEYGRDCPSLTWAIDIIQEGGGG